MRSAFAAFLIVFLWCGRAEATTQCTSGFQPRGDVCVSQRMSDYIACVEFSGGNRQELNQDIASTINNNRSVGARASGSGIILRGGGSITLDQNIEDHLSNKLAEKYFAGAMALCRDVLPPDLPKPPSQHGTASSNPTLVGGIAVGSPKDTLDNDALVQFSSSNGRAYGFKTVVVTLGAGLSQTSVSFQAFYYFSSSSVTGVTLQRTEDTTCTSPLETTTKLVVDNLIRKFGPPSDGPVESSSRSFPPLYESVDERTTKYMFSSDRFLAYLTINDKVAYPRSSGRGNELSCRINVTFRTAA